MKTKLTQEQINYLFSFCAEQGIIHYDVQTEMVDHFTEWIETNWEKQPDANFMNMIAQVKEAFPKQELNEIVAVKEKLLKKQLLNLFHTEFKSFFTIPKIILSVLIFILYFIIPWNDKRFFSDILYASLLLANGYNSIYLIFIAKNITRNNKEQITKPVLIYKKLQWLMKGYSFLHIVLIITLVFFWIFNKNESIISYSPSIALLSKIVMPFFVIGMISFIHVDVQINKKIRKLYPTAFANS